MARIRSIHPGLFTDEAFASCSCEAQVLIIGIWTECDDQGVFEWKPVTLKMRLMPVHSVDIPALLEELEANNMVKRYEHDGREYGAVRNFCKYQRPKSPKYVHTIPIEFRNYVALSPSSSEPKAVEVDPIPQKVEIPPQREEGGGRGKEKEKTSLRSDKKNPVDELRAVLDEKRSQAVIDHRKAIKKPLTPHAAELLAQKFAKCPDPNAAADFMVERGYQGFEPDWMKNAPPKPDSNGHEAPADWDVRLSYLQRAGVWPDAWGNPKDIPQQYRDRYEAIIGGESKGDGSLPL